MQFKLNLDKETKGSIRFGDGKGHNIYLTKEEAAAAFGANLPKTVTLSIDPDAAPVEPPTAAPAA